MSMLQAIYDTARSGQWADPNPADCPCRNGWFLSDVDTWHRCPIHGHGVPHPEDDHAEFDYAGSQACRSLREEGVEVVLVNSNPATIMTDRETADRVYIEPMDVGHLESIIAATEPFPFVPAISRERYADWGRPSTPSSERMLSRPSLTPKCCRL